jgi:hypothetical protein
VAEETESDAALRGLMVVRFTPNPGFEDKLNRWYNEEHFPERMRIPGFRVGRRFRSVDATPTSYLAMYELDSLAVLETDEYLNTREPASPWTEEVRRNSTRSRELFEEIPMVIDLGKPVIRRPADEL